MAKPYSKDQLLSVFQELNLGSTKTVAHAACPTCDVHTEELKAFPDLSKFVQAKNLFFKVPSKGGPLKDRLFLVCASVATEVDNKKLSARLGVKASAPLRLAADDVFDKVLQLPKGAVNPFVMINESAKEVTLLLDAKFKGETVLFHPMQNDFTTCISSEDLQKFMTKAGADGRYLYVDFAADGEIKLDAADNGAEVAKKEQPKKQPEKKAEPQSPKKAPEAQTKFADDHLFTFKKASETIFGQAFDKYGA